MIPNSNDFSCNIISTTCHKHCITVKFSVLQRSWKMSIAKKIQTLWYFSYDTLLDFKFWSTWINAHKMDTFMKMKVTNHVYHATDEHGTVSVSYCGAACLTTSPQNGRLSSVSAWRRTKSSLTEYLCSAVTQLPVLCNHPEKYTKLYIYIYLFNTCAFLSIHFFVVRFIFNQ